MQMNTCYKEFSVRFFVTMQTVQGRIKTHVGKRDEGNIDLSIRTKTGR